MKKPHSSAFTRKIVDEVIGQTGFITLTRPQVLNALDFEMVQHLSDVLERWKTDERVSQVFITGEGRAFCAGGDIRAGYEAAIRKDYSYTEQYFRAEYSLNKLVHHYPKPYIAFLNGITMGGGMGISIHGSCRIVTEHSLLSMPEVHIGFFPDVASCYFLDKCPGLTGLYLALTGDRIGPYDALFTGLATHFVPEVKTEIVRHEIAHTPLDQILEDYALTPSQKSVLAEKIDIINRCFHHETISDIKQALHDDPDPFAHHAFSLMQKASPYSLEETLAHMRKTKGWDIDQCVGEDYHLAHKMVHHADFIEGIRAAVVDKDRMPKWV
jgi:enoyl-CoA hydratase/carnithine racemase